jgi:hypothetical protein
MRTCPGTERPTGVPRLERARSAVHRADRLLLVGVDPEAGPYRPVDE